jgi:hypothetical protein
MTTIIDEGRLRFTFPNGWRVIQYDTTAFYRTKIPSDVGMAAVDFIASPNPDFTTIILIEVKDFRNHAVESRKRQTSGELVTEVIKKAIDTIAGLYIAAYNRDWDLSDFVQNSLFPPVTIELILFMEEDDFNLLSKIKRQNYKVRFDDILLKLKRTKKQLRFKPRILNTSLLKQTDGFTVIHT